MFRLLISAFTLASIVLWGCEINPENHNNDPLEQDTLTTVTFDFNIYKPRESCDDPLFSPGSVFRYNLNIYPLLENSDKGDLLYCASVQRLKRFYEFRLKPGKYQFEAAVICTGWGVACENMGFPAGNLLWDTGQFEVVRDSSLLIETSF